MSNVIQDIQHNLSILTPSPGIRGYIEVNDKLPNEVRDLIINCIHLDPTLRISFSKVKENETKYLFVFLTVIYFSL